MRKGRDSRDYSAERDVRKNRRERDGRKTWNTHGHKQKCTSTEDYLERRRKSEIARGISHGNVREEFE